MSGVSDCLNLKRDESVRTSPSSSILLDYVSSLITCNAYGEAQGWVKRRVVYTKSAVLSSPINKLLDLRKCVDCLRNYTRMYGCYLTQCVLYRV